MKSAVIILLLQFFVTGASSQKPSLYFEKLTIQNNLSNNKVNCITQDKRGFMWIGTNDGLNRFDGTNFKIFRNRPGDSSSISGNIITAVLEDEHERLWIATADGGLTRYDYKLPPALQFKQYKNKPSDNSSIPVNSINVLLDDKNGNLWLGTSGFSVLKFNKKTEKFQQAYSSGTRTILSLCKDNTGKILAGRQGGGIIKIDPATLQISYDKKYDNLYANLPHMVVTSLFADKEDTWYGSWDRVLYKFNNTSNSETVFAEKPTPNSFVSDEITSFANGENDLLWLGGRKNGLQLYDKKSGAFYQYKNNPLFEGTIADNTITCIYKDCYKRMWLGTNKGICISIPEQQEFVQTFLNTGNAEVAVTNIYDVYADKKNDLWIGTNAGIFVKRNNNVGFEYKSILFNGNKLAVTKFYQGSNGIFYIGTNYSLFIYDPVNNRVQLLPNTDKDPVMNKIIESRVVSITESMIDNRPCLIVSPYGHFFAYYDLVEKHWVSRLDSAKKIIEAFKLKDNLVHKFYQPKASTLWLANAQHGLGKWEPENAKPFVTYFKNNPENNESLSNNHVFDITDAGNNNLWISTYGGGLNIFNTVTEKALHLAPTNNLLEGIATDKKENVWMISNGHLQQYNITAKKITGFILPDLEKTGGISGYIHKVNDGRMFVCGKNYFIAFNPDSIKLPNRPANVFFTDFKIANQSFSHFLNEQKIVLNYKDNDFTIEFAAPDFSPSNPVKYAYMLVGLNKDWVENGDRNTATFSNLEGRTYLFKLRISHNPGEWIESEKTISITIVPPVWKRWWFFVLCGILIIASAYGIYRYRINELTRRQNIRNKIAKDLHDNMGSTLSSIAVYSQVALIQNDASKKEELTEVLGKIGDTSNNMIAEMNDIVWAINPGNDNMEKIILRMESFAKPLLTARNIHFNFNYEGSMSSVNLDMEKRKNFYLIFKEAITNLVKYSAAANAQIRVEQKNKNLSMTIKDDGVGFNVAKEIVGNSSSLSGNGLRNMYVRAKEMNALLNIESNIGEGTVIKLSISL